MIEKSFLFIYQFKQNNVKKTAKNKTRKNSQKTFTIPRSNFL